MLLTYYCCSYRLVFSYVYAIQPPLSLFFTSLGGVDSILLVWRATICLLLAQRSRSQPLFVWEVTVHVLPLRIITQRQGRITRVRVVVIPPKHSIVEGSSCVAYSPSPWGWWSLLNSGTDGRAYCEARRSPQKLANIIFMKFAVSYTSHFIGFQTCNESMKGRTDDASQRHVIGLLRSR